MYLIRKYVKFPQKPEKGPDESRFARLAHRTAYRVLKWLTTAKKKNDDLKFQIGKQP